MTQLTAALDRILNWAKTNYDEAGDWRSIVTLKLFQFLPFIQGQKSAIDACQMLQPQVILPTAAGGDVKFDGILTAVLSAEGTIADFQALLTKNNLSTRVIDPKPGDRFAVELKDRALA